MWRKAVASLLLSIEGQFFLGRDPRFGLDWAQAKLASVRQAVHSILHLYAVHAISFIRLGKSLIPINIDAGKYLYIKTQPRHLEFALTILISYLVAPIICLLSDPAYPKRPKPLNDLDDLDRIFK
jgi:hypothetical protein